MLVNNLETRYTGIIYTNLGEYMRKRYNSIFLYQYQNLLNVDSYGIMSSTPPHDMNKVINSHASVID